jgi:hypothetical protein
MSNRPIPTLLVEQHRLGELPADVDADIARRLVAEPPPAPSLTDEAVLRDDPPDAVVREVSRRLAELRWQEARARRRTWGLWGVGLAVAAAALFVSPTAVRTLWDGDTLTVKGEGAELSVFLDSPGGAVALPATGAVAGAGDRLQVAFEAPGATDGVLFSVDGRGSVTLHDRFHVSVPAPGRTLLPASYVLDNAPGFEAFHLVTSTRQFDVDALLAAVRARGARADLPPLPPGVDATTLVVRKEP